MTGAILTGVFSGLVSSVVIFLWVTYWRRAVVPWYEDRLYQGLRIDGEWVTEGFYPGEDFRETVYVEQNGYSVRGRIALTSREQPEEYRFEGEFRNLILTARYWTPGSNDLDRGTFTLTVKDSGNTLNGFSVGYIDQASSVVSGKYIWRRRAPMSAGARVSAPSEHPRSAPPDSK
jgi:hypothetical protein